MLDIVKNANVWLGHVLRRESLLHDIIERRMRVKATRGRKRMHLLSNLMKGKYVTLKRTAEDRNEWQKSLHFARVEDVVKFIVVTLVCVSVCLSAAECPHHCTDPDVTWRSGRGCLLVGHYWANLQAVHRLYCYDNITRMQNVSEYTLHSLYG